MYLGHYVKCLLCLSGLNQDVHVSAAFIIKISKGRMQTETQDETNRSSSQLFYEGT